MALIQVSARLALKVLPTIMELASYPVQILMYIALASENVHVLIKPTKTMEHVFPAVIVFLNVTAVMPKHV